MKRVIRGKYFNGKVWMVKAPDHPTVAHLKPMRQYVSEARLVMEKHLGRYLEPFEKVYHKDGDPSNHAISNLEIITDNSEHNKKYRWK